MGLRKTSMGVRKSSKSIRKKGKAAKSKNKAAEATTSHGTCKVVIPMDPEVWALLPEDLTNRVLAFLPLPLLFQARSVCKRWYSNILSPAFLNMHSEILGKDSPFLLFPALGDSLSYAAFNPSAREWQIMPPMSYLPPEVKFVEGVAGGLLFFSVVVHYQPVKLFVCNPLTRTWRQLPEMAHKRTPIVRHMVVDDATKTYKIVVAGNAGVYSSQGVFNRFLNTEVYDSVSGLWTETGSISSRFDPTWSSAVCDGVLYCMVNEAERPNESLGVITYNIKDGQWSNEFQQLPEGFNTAQVVECGGQVLMVAERYCNGSVKNIHLLKLEVSTREWAHVSKLPRRMLLEFRRLCEEESYSCVAQKTTIFLTSFKGMHVLVYDVVCNAWGWAPRCTLFSDQGDSRAVGFAYSPSSTAMV